jgi:hypothetical protein
MPVKRNMLVLAAVVSFGLAACAPGPGSSPTIPINTTGPTLAPTLAPTSSPSTLPSTMPSSEPSGSAVPSPS